MHRLLPVIGQLADHPNEPEIRAVLARIPQLADADLRRLAARWSNADCVADARDRALTPGAPLVVDVLVAFELISELYADDLAGEASFVAIDPRTTRVALKAVRDAVAAAYARPMLSRDEHANLSRPWRAVFARNDVFPVELGPQDWAVRALLAALPALGRRCHDPIGQQRFDALVESAREVDADQHADALARAWDAAVLTSRRRLWALVRWLGARSLATPGAGCGRGWPADDPRVTALCLDAACALLVADATRGEVTAVLTAPVPGLTGSRRAVA